MVKRGSRQPPPAPRKRKLRKCIRPSGKVKRKLNFDDVTNESFDHKKAKLEEKSCVLDDKNKPVIHDNEESKDAKQENCGDERPDSNRECENKEESKTEEKETTSADNESLTS